MIRRLVLASGAAAALLVAAGPLRAQQAPVTESVAPPSPAAPAAPQSEAGTPGTERAVVPTPAAPEAEALRAALAGLAAGNSDEERNEHADLTAFYEARGHAPLWLTPAGALSSKASLLIAEIRRADEWGLDPRDFPLPSGVDGRTAATGADASLTPQAVAAAEIGLSLTLLKYGRYARGGRIINPPGQLSSYLDRRPQLLDPTAILEGAAASEQPDAYLRGLHPPHPQFEKLRQKYLALRGRGERAAARRLLANMEQWRWMPIDMGEVHVWNNIPEFMQRVVKNGVVLRKERIIAGEIGKQTPIFSRPLRKITFKPTWIVPDSIKVRELWPSLLRGGRLMREWSLEVRTKDGQPRDWRRMNWAATDIRRYDVIQPNGPKSVMGKVKFSFPSQHTVFMHDTMTRDKWMFKAARRTYSHGCMRVANPMGLAELLLREDKGWDADRINDMYDSGPLNNEIVIDHKIPIHTTYFTALVDDDGALRSFADVYGHERRITQALEGKWSRIVKGRDHLAPVELNMATTARGRYARQGGDGAGWRRRRWGGRGFFDSLFGDD